MATLFMHITHLSAYNVLLSIVYLYLFNGTEAQTLCVYKCNDSHWPGFCLSSCPIQKYDSGQNCPLYGQQILNSPSQCSDYQNNKLQIAPRCVYHCINNQTFPTFCKATTQVCPLSVGQYCDIYGDPQLYPSLTWCDHPPTINPSPDPTKTPTNIPSQSPSPAPTHHPTPSPTNKPSLLPTHMPSDNPSKQPTVSPTDIPTPSPTSRPTLSPSNNPTLYPSNDPTTNPTEYPTSPTNQPTPAPTVTPTPPTLSPSMSPSISPTVPPSTSPTASPSTVPSTSSTGIVDVYSEEPMEEESKPDITLIIVSVAVCFVIILIIVLVIYRCYCQYGMYQTIPHRAM